MQTSELFQGTGRRKRAIARVRVTLGQGVISINKRPIEDYFPRAVLRQIVCQPLDVTQSLSRFNISVTCEGGGPSGQAGAVRHGIARALLEMDATLREPLRRNGLLTRDPREKESKKYGRKRARKRFQFSKR
jgi:small subunit ribosomal protein S9